MPSCEIVENPPCQEGNSPCLVNRSPLAPNALVKLPLGRVRARGWLRHQLELMAEGMTGRLPELSKFLGPDNGWFGTENEGWEEQPYWLRGFYNLGVLLDDARIQEESLRWIEAVIASQQKDGYYGAPLHKAVEGKDGSVVADLWPHMVMNDALISHWEHTGDERIPPMLTRFFAWCAKLPAERFIPPVDGLAAFGSWKPFIQTARSGDMLPQIYWTYNQTGEAWLLDLAARFFEHIAPPVEFASQPCLDRHVVNFTQRFRYPGYYMLQSHDAAHLAETERWYRTHMQAWGQQPGGAFGADEQIREGKDDPRQGIETCAMAEFNKSFFLLAQVTGHAVYGDRAEDIQFNSFPAASTPDLKALHYITAGNQPQLDASTNHDLFNKGRQIDYSPHLYRCCQHNVAMGWPYFAEHLWMATQDGGLAAFLHAPGEGSAPVGPEHTEMRIVTQTDYPFEGSLNYAIDPTQPVQAPLYFRIPQWAAGVKLSVNGEAVSVDAATPGRYLCIQETWQPGSRVEIEFGQDITLTEWPRHNAVTVNRGPLSYSVAIEEEWRQCGGTPEWPEWEVLPASPWNYAFAFPKDGPGGAVKVEEVRRPASQPWTPEAAPVLLRALARRIEWGMHDETVDPVPQECIAAAAENEEIRMIPMGCARLRMTCLPCFHSS